MQEAIKAAIEMSVFKEEDYFIFVDKLGICQMFAVSELPRDKANSLKELSSEWRLVRFVTKGHAVLTDVWGSITDITLPDGSSIAVSYTRRPRSTTSYYRFKNFKATSIKNLLLKAYKFKSTFKEFKIKVT